MTFLFSLYGSYQRREVEVVALQAVGRGAAIGGRAARELRPAGSHGPVAGAVPRSGSAGPPRSSIRTWPIPLLGFFRSSHDNLSWISALGTVLDAASLVLTTIEGVPRGEAKLFKRVGTHLVEDIYNLGFRDGAADGPGPRVVRPRLRPARGSRLPLGPRDAAWPAFEAARATYATRLESMAGYWATPATSWLGDPVALRAPLHAQSDP